eukprot:2763633-Ditylum_brightwellii.AAC.1
MRKSGLLEYILLTFCLLSSDPKYQNLSLPNFAGNQPERRVKKGIDACIHLEGVQRAEGTKQHGLLPAYISMTLKKMADSA